MNRLDHILDPRLIQSGVYKSVDAYQVPLWIDGRDIEFRNGRVRKARGYSALATSPVNVNALAQAHVGGTARVYLGTTTALYYYPSGGAVTSIRTGLSSGRWSLLAWGNHLLATNNVDRVQYWQNTGTAADLTDGPTTARAIRALNVFAVAFNCDGVDGRFEWCDRGNPLVWTAAADNLAGGDNIRNIASRIQAAEEWANGIACWSRSGMYWVSFVGGTAILAYQTMKAAVGAAGLNSQAVVGGRIYGLDPDRGFWVTDGVQEEWIAEPAIWDYYGPRIDFTQGDLITCHWDKNLKLVEWHWPIVGGGYEGAAFSLQGNGWAPRSWRLDAACEAKSFDRPSGANQTAVYKLGNGVNQASDAMTSYVQSKPLPLGDSQTLKVLEELRSRMTGTADLTIGVSESPDSTITWLDAEALAERNYPQRESGFFHIKISSDGIDEDWSWAGYEAFGSAGGERAL